MDIFVITVGDMQLAIPFHSVALSLPFASELMKTDHDGTGKLESSLPVVDLRKKLGFPILPGETETRVIFIDQGGRPIGLAVNRLSPIYLLQQVTMEPVHGVTHPCIKGMTMSQDEPVFLMDWDQLLSSGTGLNLDVLFSETAWKEPISAPSGFIEAFRMLSEKPDSLPIKPVRQLAQKHHLPLSVANRLVTYYALSSEGSV